MTLFQYTIYDSAHEAYFHPYSFDNDNLALRQFANMANDDTQIAKNPEDYSLWRVGEFETTTGVLTSETPVCLAKAHEHVLQSQHAKKKEKSK